MKGEGGDILKPFLAVNEHGKVGDKQFADADNILGETTPPHARSSVVIGAQNWL